VTLPVGVLRIGVPFKLYVPSAGVPVLVHVTPARSVNTPEDTVPFKQSTHVMMLLHKVLIEFTVDVTRKLVDDGTTTEPNVSIPTFEILHRFILRFPVIDVALVTVSAPSVAVPVTAALFEITNALVVSVPLV
jgi:hypothetical protein